MHVSDWMNSGIPGERGEDLGMEVNPGAYLVDGALGNQQTKGQHERRANRKKEGLDSP